MFPALTGPSEPEMLEKTKNSSLETLGSGRSCQRLSWGGGQLQGCLNHPHLFEKKQLQAVPGGENLGAGDPWDRLAVPGICWDIRPGALWSKSIHSTGTARLFPQPESHWRAGRAPASADNGGKSFIPQGKGVLFLHSDNPYFPITVISQL